MNGDLARVSRAYMLAALAHADQQRKGADGVPYINHSIEVAELVAGAGASEETVIAAILHDVLEDSDIGAAELREHFGGETADLVEALTDPPDWTSLPREVRKRHQAEHLEDADPRARLIKIADQISNLHDIARAPAAWAEDDARLYIEGAERVVAVCRGLHQGLDEAFDLAVARARGALSSR